MNFNFIKSFFSFQNNTKNKNFIKKIFLNDDCLLVTANLNTKNILMESLPKEKEKNIITIDQIINNKQTILNDSIPIILDIESFNYLLEIFEKEQNTNKENIKKIKNKLILNFTNSNYLLNEL